MIDREGLDRAATFALATMAASESPEWLRDMAYEQYSDIAWHMQFNRDCVDPDDRETWEMAYYQVYELETRHVVDRLPIEIRDANSLDVLLAINLAKSVDMHEITTTSRLECMFSLYRTLRRLHCAAADSVLPHVDADAGTESYDSMFDGPDQFLNHLAANCVGHDEEDDDEFEDDNDEWSINHGFDYSRIGPDPE